MAERHSRIAKISPPDTAGALSRKRLFGLLDECGKKSAIWVSGPPGSGKTTLVASYLKHRKIPCLWYQVDAGDEDPATFFYYLGLAAKKINPRSRKSLPLFTPEYFQGISTFARRYFEKLCEPLKPPFALVFDNFQQAENPAFFDVIGVGMETTPEGIHIIVLSRTEPPGAFARMKANGRITSIGWKDIRFTHQECRAFLKGKGGGTFSAQTIKNLHEKAEGWAAGLVLMTEAGKTKEIPYSFISELSHEAVFSYFASEILEKVGEETRDFLLRTAFFPCMSVTAAEKLTGNPEARSLLSRLSRNHYFTEWHASPQPVYQYHSLFRDYLQSRAAAFFDPGDLDELQRRTAAILHSMGQIEEAAELFYHVGEVEELARLVLSHAPALVSQGRFRLIGGWLDKIPVDRRESEPWLFYWEGVCKLLSGLLSAAHICFEKAFRLFNEKADTAGALSSWSGAVETIIYTWDDFKPLDKWIKWLQEHVKKEPLDHSAPGAKAVACMVMALYFRKFDDPQMEIWIERAIALSREAGDVNLLTQAYLNAVWYFLYTDVPRCRVLLDEAGKMVELSGSPFMKANLRGLQAVVHSSFPGWGGDAVGEILEALELSGKQGIHFYDHILLPQAAFAFLNRGDTAQLPELIEKIRLAIPPSMRNLQACYHMLVGWERLIAGDVPLALAHAQRSLRFSVESGSPCAEAMSLILVAQVLHETGDRKESLRQLGLVKQISYRLKNHLLIYLSLLMEALFALDRGDEKNHLAVLSKAMALGKQRGLTTILFWWNRRGMARLCSKAIEAGIEEDHAKSLINVLGLLPEDPVEKWPYPVRINTFGKFEMLVKDEPVQFSGKVQKKPLEMLKALIALGGKDVPEVRLSDVLWPDADGDSSHKSFGMTLLRLRKILGIDGAVQLKGGLLSLDPRYCRVDIQVFEYLAKSAEEAWCRQGGNSQDSIADAMRLSEQALSIYCGPFLPNDVELDYTTAIREKIRNSALQLVGLLGRRLRDLRQWRKAIECYRKGIGIDNLFEDFYRCLMLCHENLGQRAQALRVYEQCVSALSSALGIEPSAKTQKVYNLIRASSSKK